MKTKITKSKLTDEVRFADITPGTFFSHKEEDFIRVSTVFGRFNDVNSVNLKNGETWSFSGVEIVVPIPEVILKESV